MHCVWYTNVCRIGSPVHVNQICQSFKCKSYASTSVCCICPYLSRSRCLTKMSLAPFPFEAVCPSEQRMPMMSLAHKLQVPPQAVFIPLLRATATILKDSVSIGSEPVHLSGLKILTAAAPVPAIHSALRLLYSPLEGGSAIQRPITYLSIADSLAIFLPN